jgi:Methyltransferase domain
MFSLRAAERRKPRGTHSIIPPPAWLALTNLETRLLAVENAGELDRHFDVIICTGVLHHLAEPDAGLRALRSVLKPDGAMYLLVYAPYGRAGVHMLEEYGRTLSLGTSKQELKDLYSVLRGLPQHHPLFAAQGGSREFLDGDLLADALLNPRHRSYSVPQLFDFLERNHLKLGRWYSQAPYLHQCGSIATTPHAKKLAALPERDQYKAMELWRGVMNNHTLVVHHSDMHEGARISFDGDNYLRYVPIRVPWTRCVQERVPPGAAAVLVNHTHQFQDLFLVINAPEKRLFEAIDGHRSIADIVGKVGGIGTSSLARVFFEKLWRYDQVVFDTSKVQS